MPHRESHEFVTMLQERWGESQELTPATRGIIGRLAALDVHMGHGQAGNKVFHVATPRSTESGRSAWKESSIGLVVSKPVYEHVSTAQVIAHDAKAKDQIKAELRSSAFIEWQRSQELDWYGLGSVGIPYSLGMDVQEFNLSSQRTRRVYSKPVVMVDAASTEKFRVERNLIGALGATLHAYLSHPVRIVQAGSTVKDKNFTRL